MPEPDKSTIAAPATPEPAAAAAPPTVTITQEEWDRTRASLAHMEGALGVLQGNANRPVVVAPPAAPAKVYSDAELAEMMESGDGQKMLIAQRVLLQQQVQPVVEDYQRFRANTMHMQGETGRALVELEGKIPYYKDPAIKKQVDEFLATLPPEAQANKQAIEFAHNYVIAKPENLDKIVKERVEAELRKRGGPAGALDTGGGGDRIPEGGSKVPTVAEVLGEGAAQALRSKGESADQWAMKTFKMSWADYAAMAMEDQASALGKDVQ